MESLSNKKICPNCGATKMKDWDDLDFEEKIIAERLPASAEFTRKERKQHRFCVKCWFEETQQKNRLT